MYIVNKLHVFSIMVIALKIINCGSQPFYVQWHSNFPLKKYCTLIQYCRVKKKSICHGSHLKWWHDDNIIHVPESRSQVSFKNCFTTFRWLYICCSHFTFCFVRLFVLNLCCTRVSLDLSPSDEIQVLSIKLCSNKWKFETLLNINNMYFKCYSFSDASTHQFWSSHRSRHIFQSAHIFKSAVTGSSMCSMKTERYRKSQ